MLGKNQRSSRPQMGHVQQGGKTRNEEIGNRKKRNVEIRKWSSLLKITMLVI